MNKTFAIAALLALLIAAMPLTAPAQDSSGTRTVTVIGTGRIQGDDVSSARDQAISDCLVTAVSMVTMDLTHQGVLIQSFQDINRVLFSQAEQVVQDYRVLTETSTGSTYRVMVEATISVNEIRKVLSENHIEIQNSTPLKVLLLIAEKDLGDTTYHYWWDDPFAKATSESGLGDALGKQGLMVIDHGQIWPPSLDISGMQNAPGAHLSDAQALVFGKWFHADVVVVGTATAEPAANELGNNLKSFKGTLTVRALRTDTGAVLAQTSQNILAADTDALAGAAKALVGVGTQTGKLLAPQIQAAWQQAETKGPISATIVVEGDYQLAQLVAFRKRLAGMPGLTHLQTTEITPDETTLAFDYEGTTQKLAQALLVESFKGFGLHISDAGPNTIRLSLVSD